MYAKNYQNQFMFVRVMVRQSSDIFWDTVYSNLNQKNKMHKN